MLIQTAVDLFWQTPHPPLQEIDLPAWKELSISFPNTIVAVANPHTEHRLLPQENNLNAVQASLLDDVEEGPVDGPLSNP